MKIIYAVLPILFLSFNLQAQCSITNLSLTDLPCDANGEYYIELDFDYI